LCYNGLFPEGKAKESNAMNEEMGTGDLIIGIVAAIGVVILVVVFIVVVKNVLLKKDSDLQ
jgi:hypothetical protein